MKDGLYLVGVKDFSGSDWRIRGRQREEPEGCHLRVGHYYYWRCCPQVHCRSSTRPRMLPQSPASPHKGPIDCSLLPSPAHLAWHSEAVDVSEWGNWFCALVSIQIFSKRFKAFPMCYMCVQSLSCVWLFDPTNCSQPGSSVQGIFWARILEWVAISYSRGPSWPRDRTWVSCVSRIGRQILCRCTTWEARVYIPCKLL